MRIKIEFETDNAAFADGNAHMEIARIFADISDGIDKSNTVGSIRDINGNKIGKWHYYQEE